MSHHTPSEKKKKKKSRADEVAASVNEALSKRAKWEGEMADRLVDKHGFTNSDAQGFIEAHPFELAQFWSKGYNAKKAADELIKKTSK